jgi:ribosome-binding factor A
MSAKNSTNVLKDVVQEALSTLEDINLSSLTISSIDGSKNKSDVKVYIFFEDFDEKEILKRLKKASKMIMNNAFISSGWVHFPKLTFHIDHSFEKQKRIEELFAKIKSKDNE